MRTKTIAFLLAATVPMFASPGTDAGYVAHEWGTFTSVQASDGVQMKWNPLTVAELPDFIYGVHWPEGKNGGQNLFAAKTAFLALQRMETPVIYFYANEPQNVNVSVNFPSGTITEWYPKASRANEIIAAKDSAPLNGQIRWQDVEILGKSQDSSLYPKDISGSHYYAARETEANPIRIKTNSKTETEKFLFYRGVASFRAPLTVKQQGDNAETLEVSNDGAEALQSLFIYQIRNGRAVWTELQQLPAGESKTIQLNQKPAISLTEFHEQIAPQLIEKLTRQGLFEPEAKAMVKTWDDSWFNEQGTRVLYILPRAWTDRTLPLSITPAPRQIARVMVGRAELITPKMEFGLLREMIQFNEGDETARAIAVENTRKLGLGRFTETTMRRILAGAPKSAEFSNRSWELLSAASKSARNPAKPLARN
jgi:hypothetical protein